MRHATPVFDAGKITIIAILVKSQEKSFPQSGKVNIFAKLKRISTILLQ